MTPNLAGFNVEVFTVADSLTAWISQLPRVTLFPTFGLMHEECGGLGKIENGGRKQAEIENGQH